MDKQERQIALLGAIVQEYIQSAHPVSSKTLVTDYGFEYSPATIRNDMAELEREGYITQPHTSAGRVPTEKGYQFYIAHFLEQPQLNKRQQRTLHERALAQQHASRRDGDQSEDMLFRNLAKAVADIADEAVIISYGDNHFYYTGISHMFRKPEFAGHADMMLSLGEVFDEMEQIMTGLQGRALNEVEVLIGHENPFSENCSVVLSEYHIGNERAMMGILGPMRMHYDTNIALLDYMDAFFDE